MRVTLRDRWTNASPVTPGRPVRILILLVLAAGIALAVYRFA
jgi:hypothetical protein